MEGLREVHSHVQALSQCHKFLRRHDLRARAHADTAGAAAEIAERGDPAIGAIASALSAEIYGLDILASDIEDADHNTTRFLILGTEAVEIPPGTEHVLTSFVFRVPHRPGGSLQGHGRLRHEWRQHDQA